MADISKPERPELISKFEPFLLPHNLSLIGALAFYFELVLRYFYQISLWDFANFAAVYEFLKNVRPLALALVICGIPVLRRIAWLITWVLMALLWHPVHFFRKEENEKIDKMLGANQIMFRSIAEILAYRKNDTLLIERCQHKEQAEREIYDAKNNVGIIFIVLVINLVIWWYQGAVSGMGLILVNLPVQLLGIFFTGIYAGIYPTYWLEVVSVSEDYIEEEIVGPVRNKVSKRVPPPYV